MVSQYTTLTRAAELWKGTLQEGIPHQTYPETFLEQLHPDIEAVEREAPAIEERIFHGRISEGSQDLEARLVEHTRWALESDALYARIAEKILRADPDFDVMAVYFGAPDVAGHRFWRYYRPGSFRFPPSTERTARFGPVIPETYRLVDEWIGRLLSLCDESVTVFVVSDHGMYAINQHVYFEALERVQQMNSGHHLDPSLSPGVFVAAGPGIQRAGNANLDEISPDDLDRVGSVLSVTPTLLYLLGLAVGRDMDGSLMEPILDPGFRERHALAQVDTYEAEEAGSGEEEASDPELDREMLERFRALGYIE
jgi:hypothetical protein